MSAPSSPPAGPGYVPYLPYKSKRHSRNLSSSNSHLTPNQSPPPVGKVHSSSVNSTSNALLQPQQYSLDNSDDDMEESTYKNLITPPNPLESVDHSTPISVVIDPPASPDQSTSEALAAATKEVSKGTVMGTNEILPVRRNQTEMTTSDVKSPNSSKPSSSTSMPKKASTFRRLPARTTHITKTEVVTHSRNVSTISLPPRSPLPEQLSHGSPPVYPTRIPPSPRFHSPVDPAPPLTIQQAPSRASHTSSTSATQSQSTNPHSRMNTPISTTSSRPAPYRPGFQPKGVYRPLTDEFIARRRLIRDDEVQGGIARVERTKLERRLEKLIALHFSHPLSPEGGKQSLQKQLNARENRRASSFFDFQGLRGININDAGDIWRGVVRGGLGDATKTDIRASEQRITPWQSDAEVSKCPLCSATFHPLTNRKHHCRLCGQIICSLPIKHPQREVMCSILFVVDTKTREIEEVGEGVDYGVKRRRVASTDGPNGLQEDEDKFLKGVRICRECRPILLRQQYHQQAGIIPPFVKMYENFINLEADIEESLPKFQELLMSLTHHDQPTREASAARKRLLESFARYDKLSKDIRALPCPNGTGSSQDRIQAAVMTRANLFLQKNMFPLQSLPTPKTSSKPGKPHSSTSGPDLSAITIDPDSSLAHALQPLLEQETLLESFIDEAQAQRKFEDVKTLRVNLAEIRQEIERILEGKKL
ncbi:hypothetical protein HYPSUDRAFT_45069 [Hypholoma sublateritium FD-334 SS-4]|uniref:FYVE-type domain-containing protein n=1 Tax=Hypholoma sublateritium (strain FD-334 SS-4) TaxID=945553 RepID=A0A0D2KV40_HYPSF|nr:hypothetical protein HYPSUDRAFT_45069 [Hypholoma sublateritium FD-334 SS-4]